MYHILHQYLRHDPWISIFILTLLHTAISSPVANSSDDSFKVSDPVCEVRYFDRMFNSGSFLHVTDIHIDPDYLPNSDPKTHCHRISSTHQDNIAGEYGALGSRCDTPIKLADQAFIFMKQAFHDVDFVIYTGDSARHDRDSERSRKASDVMKDHGRVLSYFKGNFDLDRTLVVPTIGNNDVLKHNLIAEGEDEALYKKLLALWSGYKGLDILSPGQAQSSFLKGGYWVQSLPRVPNVKIVNLNSMFFYVASKDNTFCDNPKAAGSVQLDWYEQTLKDVAKNNQKVYVMGHVPPKDEHGREILLDKCYRRFVFITGEYASFITGMFWGHINSKQHSFYNTKMLGDAISFISKARGLKMSYSFTTLVNQGSPVLPSGDIVAVMTTSPSIIPVNHPAIRSYKYDPGNGDLLGYTQYYANLTDANRNISKGLVFKEEYNTWKDYRLPALTLKYWKIFLPRLIKDKSLWKRYLYFQDVGAASQ